MPEERPESLACVPARGRDIRRAFVNTPGLCYKTAMDKKALKREYRETARPIGVYQIRNTVSGKVLIGTSIDLPSILNRHRAELRLGGHRNRALQRDWNELGPEAFAFEVLDTLAPSDRPAYDPADDLKALEELWLEKLQPFEERGYNAKPKG